MQWAICAHTVYKIASKARFYKSEKCFKNWKKCDLQELASVAADFVFSSLCQFGFCSCDVVSRKPNVFEAFLRRISVLWWPIY
jgi:hypothetical protein